MEYYIIERRKGNIEIEDANCFLSSSMENVIEWINSNKDYDKREFYWYWVVIKIKLNDEYGGELFKVFDWDGNELDGQPINNMKNKLTLHAHNDIEEGAKWFKIPIALYNKDYVYIMQEDRCVFVGTVNNAQMFLKFNEGKYCKPIFPLLNNK
jgi:hypothetical protein